MGGVIRQAPLSAARLESVFEAVPAAIAVIEGPEHRFVLANDGYRKLVRGREVVGKPVADALPEVVEQGFIALLDRVRDSGKPYYGAETPVLIGQDEVYVNFVYLPMRELDGSVGGILVHAVEVTELVRARRQVEALVEQLSGEQRRLETLIEQMPAGVVIAEVPSGRLVAANQQWREFFGVSLEAVADVGGYAVFSARHADGREFESHEYPLARTVARGEVVVGEELRIERGDGSPRIIEVSSAPVISDGVVELGVATFFDVTEQRRTALLVEGNNLMLELVATGAPLHETLDRLVRMLEEHATGELLGSILLLDRDGLHLRHGAAPRLPDAYNEAIDGIEIGPSVGSCGTAAYRRQAVYVSDIERDPLWADFKDLALEHGLRACWSTPIVTATGEILGTFAMYHRHPRRPTPEDLGLVEVATRTAAIAIERRRLEDDRARNLRVVEQLNRVGEAINATLDLDDVVRVVTDAAISLTGADFGAFLAAAADGGSFPAELVERTLAGDGGIRTRYLATPVTSTEGAVLGGLFFGHDGAGIFTEEHERLLVGIAAQAAVAIERAQLYVREQTARAEAERRAQAALSLEHVSDGVCLVDEQGVVRVWNPAAAAITGVHAADVVGAPLAGRFPAFARVRGGASETVAVGDLWLAVSATSFRDGVVYTFRDRTAEHRLEAMRSEIVATVSHELRTPLAAVYGAAQTLSRADVLADERLRGEFLRMIVEETQRLTRVADQILLTSGLEKETAETSLVRVDVTEVVERVVGLATARSDVPVAIEAPERLGVAGDADKLQQVVANLLDNAVKYGAAGGRVVVRARAVDGRVRLAVADWGQGVPPGEADRVFDRFYRLDPDQRRGVAGTGLGLYICRELVRQMGGEIWVEPTAGGRGATFTVELQAA